MKLSRASLYAIHGMVFIAGAVPSAVVPISRIRRRLRMSVPHLAKIFQALVRVGLLKSKRGAAGGFTLARPAHAVTALDVIRAVEGGPAESHCAIHPDSSGRCCAVGRLLRKGRRRMNHVLSQATLADLSGRGSVLLGGRRRFEDLP